MSMTVERYNEIVEKLNDFAKRRNGMPPHWILMEMDHNGIVDDLPDGITQKEILALIQETCIPVAELNEWAWKYQAILDAEPIPEPEPVEDDWFDGLDEEDWCDDLDDEDGWDADYDWDDSDEKISNNTSSAEVLGNALTVEVEEVNELDGKLTKPMDETKLMEAIRRDCKDPKLVPDAVHLSGTITELGLYTIAVEKDGKPFHQRLWVVPKL